MGQHKWKEQLEHPTNSLLTRQWELDGLCEQCIRRKYCSKKCQKRMGLIKSMVAKALQEKGIHLHVEDYLR